MTPNLIKEDAMKSELPTDIRIKLAVHVEHNSCVPGLLLEIRQLRPPASQRFFEKIEYFFRENRQIITHRRKGGDLTFLTIIDGM